jgi:hypothetical protein
VNVLGCLMFFPRFKDIIYYLLLMSVKIPYLNTNSQGKADTGFLDMIQNRICPNFQLVSLASALIGACLIVFIFSRVVYSPGGYR